MTRSLSLVATLLAALAFALLPLEARPDEPGETVVLVAKRNLQDKIYGSTILFAKPLGAERHVGIILNKPSRTTLGKLFPEHAPSQKIADPVFLGGPYGREVIFALVQSTRSPGGRSFQITPELYLAFDSSIVDRIIEKEHEQARFFAGLVVWQEGELRAEIQRGVWYVLDAQTELLLKKKTDGLWEELVRRFERKANTI
ncbi:MAG TPA: YqgE/AlgH family protein [Burkholderiales bacterium]|nr:YqgE/AlgH family protein [Burkholderiales bacterium]